MSNCYVNNDDNSLTIQGASEMLMANAVSQLAARTPGKEAAAMEAFAVALRQVSVKNKQNRIESSCLFVSLDYG
jgi:hypothetical protein